MLLAGPRSARATSPKGERIRFIRDDVGLRRCLGLWLVGAMFSGTPWGLVALTALGLAVGVSPADAVEAQVARPKGEAPVAVATRTVEPIRRLV
jgi:hypothetical protein